METKKTVGIITFHAAHNYGAMLQAHALQHVVDSMGFQSEIINFRTERQRHMYRLPFLKGSLIERLKSLAVLRGALMGTIKKYRLFEKFLREDMRLSAKEYKTLEELQSANLDYDIYISGSDQIWNLHLADFDEAYLLPFVKNRKRIAYAASAKNAINEFASFEHSKKLAYISKYDFISAREKPTSEILAHLLNREVATTLDPTLLVSAKYWDKLAGEEPLINGDYIFHYTPSRAEDSMNNAEKIAEKFGSKVVSSMPFLYWSDHKKWGNTEIYIGVGPREFLNLIKFAKFVVNHSFHGVVFSILFEKPFVCDGMENDVRLNNILGICNLKDRLFSGTNFDNINLDALNPSTYTDFLNAARQESLNWLKNALSS